MCARNVLIGLVKDRKSGDGVAMARGARGRRVKDVGRFSVAPPPDDKAFWQARRGGSTGDRLGTGIEWRSDPRASKNRWNYLQTDREIDQNR